MLNDKKEGRKLSTIPRQYFWMIYIDNENEYFHKEDATPGVI